MPFLTTRRRHGTPRNRDALLVSERWFGLGIVLLTCAWVAVAAYAVYPILPYSPFRLPFGEGLETQSVLPQGWGFFTRDPREPRTFVFVHESNRWRSALLGPHGKPANAFGFNRVSRGQGVELGMLQSLLHNRKWARCRYEVHVCLDGLPRGVVIRNSFPQPTICGTVGVVLRRPVPWAWRRTARDSAVPSVVYKAVVLC